MCAGILVVPLKRSLHSVHQVEGLSGSQPKRQSSTTFTLGNRAARARDAVDLALRVPRRARLVYRDVASAGNRLTLIAAIVPPRAVTTHTLLCLRTPLPLPAQRVLCALLNSYVANYVIRLRVNTHVTVSLVSRLPVPVLEAGHPLFVRLAACVEALACGTRPAEEMEEYAEVQAIAAWYAEQR